MDLLQEVALKYGDLLNKDYLIKASYKKETIEICFFFLPEHFCHLVGFHKLLDMKDLTKPKYLYTSIISKKITYDTIKNSKFLDDMYDRLQRFCRINELIDHLKSGEVVIEFSQKNRTKIQADFLLYDLSNKEYAHLFLRKNGNHGYVPCSFFCRSDEKYICNNKKYRITEFIVSPRQLTKKSYRSIKNNATI